MANKPPSKTDFFNMYSAHSNKLERKGYQVTQRKEPSRESSAVLQTPTSSYAASKKWEENHDQRVPFDMAGDCGSSGKENRFPSRDGLSSSNLPLQGARFIDDKNKRSTSQILALFSSRKNMPQPKITLEANCGIMIEKQFRNWHDIQDKKSPQAVASQLSAMTTNSIFEIGDKSQPDILDNDSFGQGLEIGEDLGDSLNLSADSFAACSSETKAESTVLQADDSKENYDCDVSMEAVKCEDATQESAFSQEQNESWSQNDSESVSPLMRFLTSVEKDHAGGDDKKSPYDVVQKSGQSDHCHFQNPSSAPVRHPSSVLHSSQSPNLYSTQQSSYGLQRLTPKDLSSADFVQARCLPVQNQYSCIPNITPPSVSEEDVCTSYKSMPPTQPKDDHFSINTNRLSSHPGSLFAYSELQTRDQNNIVHDFEQWESSYEQNIVEGPEGNFLQCEMSPEFYPPENEKITQWTVAPILKTKVIPTDIRTVSRVVHLIDDSITVRLLEPGHPEQN